MTDDEFPLDKPELANAAAERFRYTQEASVVRDLTAALKRREATITRLTAHRDALLRAIHALVPSYRSPKENCWCPHYHNTELFGHHEGCLAAQAALAFSLATEASAGPESEVSR